MSLGAAAPDLSSHNDCDESPRRAEALSSPLGFVLTLSLPITYTRFLPLHKATEVLILANAMRRAHAIVHHDIYALADQLYGDQAFRQVLQTVAAFET